MHPQVMCLKESRKLLAYLEKEFGKAQLGFQPLFLVAHGLFHIKNPATIKAYYNQCIFTGHIHWVSLISSHSGWGLKTIQDHMNPFN